MSRADQAKLLRVAKVQHQVQRYVLDYCHRGGDEDKPLPFDQQPSDVRAAITLVAELKALEE